MQNFNDHWAMTAPDTALCLEFANTADWHASAQPTESLLSYHDLLTWAQAHHLVSADTQSVLARMAADEPAAAAAVLAQAIALREAIYRIFVALAASATPVADDIACLNRALAEALPYLQVQPSAQGYVWGWSKGADTVAALLRPIALSAANLVTSVQVDRVKQCEDERGCGFLFIDTSKNRSRRWCSMESCGNRAKVKRHRRRLQ